MAFKKKWTVPLLLLFSANLEANAANLPANKVYGNYHVLTYPPFNHGRLKDLVSAYLSINGVDARNSRMRYDENLADGMGGAELRLAEAHVEGVKQLLSEQGLELIFHEIDSDLVSGLNKTEARLLKSGNELLVRYARRLLESSEGAAPETIKAELYVDFQNWRAKLGKAKSSSRLKLIEELVSREGFFLNFSTAWLAFLNHDNLINDLKNRGNSPLEFARGAKLYFETLNMNERKREVRLQFIESRISVWLDNLNPREDISFNPETREVFAHGLLMTLSELEATYVSRNEPIVNTPEIVDVLNRMLVNASWIYSQQMECGPRCLELLDRISQYDGLIPYLKLVISAKLGTKFSLAPKPSDLSEYGELEGSMTFESSASGLIVPKLHLGNISSVYSDDQHAVQVYDGIKFIDSWFKKHGMPTKDWTSAKGISLDDQRTVLRHQRRNNTCETLLSGPRRPQKPDRWY